MYRSIENTPLPEWVTNKLSSRTRDKIVDKVIDKFISRSELGMSKYGTTLHDNHLPTFDWLIHIQEELMDAVLYLEKLKQIKIKEARVND